MNGYRFYEDQREGLGEYFLDTLYSDIESLRISAGAHALCFGGFRRLLSKRFPFAVYFRLEQDQIQVFAVLDCRRDPVWILRQVTGRRGD